jgi:hypothetical protein
MLWRDHYKHLCDLFGCKLQLIEEDTSASAEPLQSKPNLINLPPIPKASKVGSILSAGTKGLGCQKDYFDRLKRCKCLATTLFPPIEVI